MYQFIPHNFLPPQKLETDDFIARKLCASDVYLDYLAVMSNIEIIRKTRGGDWPTKELSFEDDLIDLAWHQREFEHGSSFAYTVMNKDQTECLGCFYLYPPGFRDSASENSDVDVSFWVIKSAYENGLYRELYFSLKNWLEENWPFKNVYWSNKEIPEL